MNPTEIALSRLSNAMRIYAEACANFEYLKRIDRDEAIDNLDMSFESKLEAFHSLYDIDHREFNYFENADTALLIALRNAIHHRDHIIFRSWNKWLSVHENFEQAKGNSFLFATHFIADTDYTSHQFYNLNDFYLRFDPKSTSVYSDTKLKKANKERLFLKLSTDLGLDELSKHATSSGYDKSKVYINIIPIFMSAISRVFESLRERDCKFDGFDAEIYESHFSSKITIYPNRFTYRSLMIS